MTSPSTTVEASTAFISGDTNIDALLSGKKWGSSVQTPAILSYSFPWQSGLTAVFSGYNGQPYSTLKENSATQHFGFNSTQVNSAINALNAWANIANIKLTKIIESDTNVGDIRFAFTSAAPDTKSTEETAWGWSRYPDSYWPNGGDVWVNTALLSVQSTDWSTGSNNFYSLTHEIGHSLGLKHTFEDPPLLSKNLDSRLYSVMSYTDAPKSLFVKVSSNIDGSSSFRSFNVVPETPMLLDIAVMQYLYGANNSYKTGNDTYTFDPLSPFFKTIWDAGGIDTISVANFTNSCEINLNAGSFSKITIKSDSTAGYNWIKPPPTPTYDGTNNLCIAYNVVIENAIGGFGNDVLIGNGADNSLDGGEGTGTDSALYSGRLANFSVTKSTGSYTVTDKTGTDGTDTLQNIEVLKFSDKSINLTIQAQAKAAAAADVTRLSELYIAFFNRLPDADGLSYWIGQKVGGQSINQIAENFYNAGVQYSSLTGFSASMSNTAFIDVIYKNVLGRTEGAEAGGLAYWNAKLIDGSATRGSLVSTILDSAHTFKGNKDYGYVADLLDNKIAVAQTFAIDWGLNYNTASDSITQGMAIAAAITPTSTAAAISLIGVDPTSLNLG